MSSDGRGAVTHLARVDLLTAEGVVVGPHFEGVVGDAVPEEVLLSLVGRRRG